MSRIGLKPVKITSGASVDLQGRVVQVKGPKGELSWELPAVISVKVDGELVTVSRADEKKETRALHGTARSLIANMIEGVTNGYSKSLEIQGVGFKAQIQGRKLVMNVGFSHPVEYEAPEGVEITVPDQTNITVTGTDKQLVGMVSARIRGFCPAEPYKGKGVRYKGEYIRRKAGKTVA